MNSSYAKARELNFSDEQIADQFLKKDPEFKQKYEKAIQLGHSPEEIFNQAQQSYQKKQEFQKLEDLQNQDLDPEIERHIARFTSRAGEQILGAPGNIRDLAYAVGGFIKNADKSGSLPSLLGVKKPQLLQKAEKKIDEVILPIAKTVTDLLDYIPTSSQLRKKSEELTKGYTSPQGELERIGDEAFEKIVASALPGQGARNIWRNIAAPIAGILGKEAVKYVGGGETSQALTELGLNVALPLMAGNAPQLNRNMWQNLERTAPNISVSAQQMRQRATQLRNRIQQEGLGSRGENQVIRVIDQLLENTQNGQLTSRQLIGMNRSLNAIRGDPAELRGAETLLNEVSNMIRQTGRQFENVAPEFYQQWRHANEVHGAIQGSNYIANVIRNNVSEPLMSEGARALFGAAVHGTAKAASVIPPVYLIYKGTQVLHRMARSPQLMGYYTGVLANSLRGNIAAAADNLNKLDEALLKEEKKQVKPPFKTSSQKKSPSS